MAKECKRCGKITKHLTCGNCYECHEKLKIEQYIEWTGEKEWLYDHYRYWKLAPEKMYQEVIGGHSVSKVATEFGCSTSTVYSSIRSYCKDNEFDTPFRKRKRKPNGLFCLACKRPLIGSQKKWCDNDDCGGWADLHPIIQVPCDKCGKIIQIRKDKGEPRHNWLCVIEGTCCRCGKTFLSRGYWDNRTPIAWSCKDCGNPPMREGYMYSLDDDGNIPIYHHADFLPKDGDITYTETIDVEPIFEQAITDRANELGITREELLGKMEKREISMKKERERKIAEWKY
ncbi:MAG: helix-turn-helix domain-containing protein [Candidatus Thorarchaeota archaeon]